MLLAASWMWKDCLESTFLKLNLNQPKIKKAVRKVKYYNLFNKMNSNCKRMNTLTLVELNSSQAIFQLILHII